MPKNLVYIDIETIPTQDSAVRREITKGVKAPANMKKKETIDKWFAENGEQAKEEAVSKTSFNGGLGELFCIGLICDDGEMVFKRESLERESEAKMLKEFNDYMFSVNSFGVPHFVGHYISGFDLRFIYHRMIINNVEPKFHIPVNDAAYKGSYSDTMFLWAGAKDTVSLDNLCKYLGVDSPKGDLDGSKVWEYVQDGKWQEVWNYCLEDVRAVKECHKRITFA